MDENLHRCLNLLKENEDDVRENAEHILLTLCQNILLRPEEKQRREVRLDDPAVIEKLLPAAGAMECLFEIGFVEAADSLVLPPEASLTKLRHLQKFLSKDTTKKSDLSSMPEVSNLIATATTSKEKKFLSEIVQRFKSVMRYENSSLQEKARKLIPIVDLEIATMSRIRDLQKHAKLNHTNEEKNTTNQCIQSDIDAKDLFLLELLHWFKHKFFKWVDNPTCSICFKNCEFHKVVPSNNPQCSRIELHRCTNCEALIKFPRYHDPEPLLTLRRGRCGEWANVFSLFCRVLNYDTRLVWDLTDHIWTEVWSVSQKRWIHLDPCENTMDRPLMYEKGWKKKLNYIIAYSKDEVQDVTWRYTQDQIGVMERRKALCSESTLLQLIELLNKQRQSSPSYGTSRRKYVIKRRLLELVELLYMPNQKNCDETENYQGRSTGSYAWKLSRGEIAQDNLQSHYLWDVSKYGENFKLYYSIVDDAYKVVDGNGKTLEKKSGWQNGVNAAEGGIFRKLEEDWKMVYLARSSGATHGTISWSFEVKDPKFCIFMFDLRATTTVFHGANISWQVEAFFDDREKLVLPIEDCTNYRTKELKGAVKLILTVRMSGGQGDVAWQHAQLFRQSLEYDNDQSMLISIRFSNR